MRDLATTRITALHTMGDGTIFRVVAGILRGMIEAMAEMGS